MAEHLLEQLDFLYMPSADVARELKQFEKVPGARVVFAIAEMETRVAMVELSAGPPAVLLAGHLEGERPVLLYRVADLDAAIAQFHKAGWRQEHTVELPMGPACVFTATGGHRLGIYEQTRAGVVKHFEGRRDF
jgi:hypothetical protein